MALLAVAAPAAAIAARGCDRSAVERQRQVLDADAPAAELRRANDREPTRGNREPEDQGDDERVLPMHVADRRRDSAKPGLAAGQGSTGEG
jgi:hypothetical protein